MKLRIIKYKDGKLLCNFNWMNESYQALKYPDSKAFIFPLVEGEPDLNHPLVMSDHKEGFSEMIYKFLDYLDETYENYMDALAGDWEG